MQAAFTNPLLVAEVISRLSAEIDSLRNVFIHALKSQMHDNRDQ